MWLRSFRSIGARAVLSFLLLSAFGVPLFADEPAVVRIWNYNVHDKKYQQKMYKLFNP